MNLVGTNIDPAAPNKPTVWGGNSDRRSTSRSRWRAEAIFSPRHDAVACRRWGRCSNAWDGLSARSSGAFRKGPSSRVISLQFPCLCRRSYDERARRPWRRAQRLPCRCQNRRTDPCPAGCGPGQPSFLAFDRSQRFLYTETLLITGRDLGSRSGSTPMGPPAMSSPAMIAPCFAAQAATALMTS